MRPALGSHLARSPFSEATSLMERLGLFEGHPSGLTRAGACRRIAIAAHIYQFVRLELSLRSEDVRKITDLELLRQIAISADEARVCY